MIRPLKDFCLLRPRNLSKITSQPEALWKNLVRSGYIDGEGSLLPKAWEVAKASHLWGGLQKMEFLSPDGTIRRNLKDLKGMDPHLWIELLTYGFVDENGGPSEKFPDLRQSQDLGLDKNFRPQKAEIIRILRIVHLRLMVFEWIESAIIAVILALIIQTLVIQAFRIPSGSMRMTLLEGDRILVSKFRYGPKIPFSRWRLPGISQPKRGDVVVFINPEDRKRAFIKRLIAVGGETVEIKDGRIYINNKPILDGPIVNIYYYNQDKYGHGQIKVPPGNLFVLGDNSGSSRDSRFFGFVPYELLVGKAELIYWPLDRLRIIK